MGSCATVLIMCQNDAVNIGRAGMCKERQLANRDAQRKAELSTDLKKDVFVEPIDIMCTREMNERSPYFLPYRNSFGVLKTAPVSTFKRSSRIP